MSPYIYSLLSNFSFGLGSQFFAHYSKKISPVWTNMFKGVFVFFLFSLTVLFTTGFSPISFKSAGFFMLSGFIGLGFADIFIFKAFSVIGPSRTIMVASMETVIVGILSYFVFGEPTDLVKLCSIFFFLVCVFIFAFENFKKTSKWHWSIMGIAFIGVSLEAVAVITTRAGFNLTPSLNPIEANVYRSIGGLLAFLIVANIFKVNFFATLKGMKARSIGMMSFGAFIGSYLCLIFYLTSIKTGHLATVAALSTTGVIFAAFFECVFEKKWPSKYLITAFCFFMMGMYVLLGTGK
ncbi:EamA-like transporter family protein [Parelusimicrobium proximum]|uniref:EamA family transporter n=1 Tax=Parelusimicrobium proximum TaxID=3228953 RepID=UPI003D17B75C